MTSHTDVSPASPVEHIDEAGSRARVGQSMLDGLMPIVALVAAVVVWGVLVAALDPPAYIIPSPQRVVREFASERQELLTNMLSTTQVAIAGLLLSTAMGMAIGFAIAWWQPVKRILLPPLIVSQSIPKIALAPLFVVWFGYGALPKVLVIILVTIYPVVVACAIGVQSLPLSTMTLARSMGLKSFALFRKILLPASAPHLVAAFRIAASLALIGAIIAEYVGSSDGIGVVLLRAIGTQNTALTFAGIILCGLVGSLIYLAATALAHLATLGLPNSARQR